MKNLAVRVFTVLILFMVMVFNSSNPTCASELAKLKPVCFDVSNSILFIPMKNANIEALTPQVKDTNTIELDIGTATVEAQPDNLTFSEGNLKEFEIVKKPDRTILKFVFKDGYNPSNVKFEKINNSIIVNYKTIQPYNMNYYVNTYREDTSSLDYKENTTVTTKSITKQDTLPVNDVKDNKLKTEIDTAFENSNKSSNEVYTALTIDDLTKDTRLRSKYFLFASRTLDNVFKLSGIGTISVQKPFILENPKRMVFDIPNTMLNPDLHGKELTLENGDILKIAQFNPTTARLVVTSNDAPQYIPVFYPDSESILLANPKNILTTHIPKHKSNIVKFNYLVQNGQNNFFIEFDNNIVYAIKRTSEYLFVYFLNAEKYNDTLFHTAIKNTPYSNIQLHLLSTGMRLKLPLKDKHKLATYISPDGKLFKISTEMSPVIKEQKKEQKIKELTKKEGSITPSPKYKDNRHVIVLDAGHGGKDCGALRGDILEKTINLDVCMKLQEILKKKGYKVYMTRTDDTYVSLEDRTIFTAGINPAAFVSVHVNSCNAETPNGIETHYYNENSIELADCVHKNLTRRINTNNRGLFRSKFYVINHTTAPAILVEIGFISNDKERKELITPTRQQQTAEGIADGIIEFLKTLK